MTERTPIPRGVQLLIVALAIHSFATSAVLTIVGKQVFDMTGREIDLGWLGLFQFVPVVLVAPVAGTVADRFDRRLVVAAGVVVELVSGLLLWRYVAGVPTGVGPIFGLIFAYSFGRAFATPAVRSLPIDLAPIDIVERVMALRSAAMQMARIAGPVAAGFLFVVAIELPYLVGAVVTVIGVLLLVAVPAPRVERLDTPPGARQVIRDAFDGLAFIRRTPVMRGAILLDLFAVLFGGAVALLPAIADERLGVGAVGFGWLRAAFGIGALATSFLYAIRPIDRHVGRLLFAMVAVFGLATIVLGLTQSYAVAFAAILILAGADALSVIIRSTLVPLASPENMRGRVLAVENVFIGASNELGAVESGFAGQILGLVGAVVLGGAATLVVVAVGWFRFSALRDVDRYADVVVGPP